MEDILAIVLIFGGGSIFLFAISPIGRAIADRIRGAGVGAAAPDGSMRRLHETQQAILDDLDVLRQEMGEVQERLDFTERLLARHRDAERLPAGEVAAKPSEGES